MKVKTIEIYKTYCLFYGTKPTLEGLAEFSKRPEVKETVKELLRLLKEIRSSNNETAIRV